MPKSKKSTTKKTTPTKSTKKEISKKVDIKKVKLPKVKNMESLKPALKIVAVVLLIIASLAVIDLAVQYFNNDYSVAIVNGRRVPVSQWHEKLESAYGPSVASQMIDEEIVKMEAKEAGIKISKEDIDKEMNTVIESIGGEEMFEAALEANNITREELKDQIEMNLLTTELLAPDLEYTEEDVKEFFDQYSGVIFPEETAELEEGELLDFEQYKEETEEMYVQQEVQNKRNTWLNEKRSEYKIQDNSAGKPKYGFLTITTNIVNSLLENISSKEE